MCESWRLVLIWGRTLPWCRGMVRVSLPQQDVSAMADVSSARISDLLQSVSGTRRIQVSSCTHNRKRKNHGSPRKVHVLSTDAVRASPRRTPVAWADHGTKNAEPQIWQDSLEFSKHFFAPCSFVVPLEEGGISPHGNQDQPLCLRTLVPWWFPSPAHLSHLPSTSRHTCHSFITASMMRMEA